MAAYEDVLDLYFKLGWRPIPLRQRICERSLITLDLFRYNPATLSESSNSLASASASIPGVIANLLEMSL